VRRLCISEARRADSTLASKLRSLLLDAAVYALRYGQPLRQKRRLKDSSPLLVLFMRSLCLDSLDRRENSARRRHLG